MKAVETQGAFIIIFSNSVVGKAQPVVKGKVKCTEFLLQHLSKTMGNTCVHLKK